ncbi:DEAD/DEAH box helicase [Pseudomonas sp. HR96]|uniref:DEAD/DEAH box helicase n=1 Tax=Pseudomonas sp. HR96 TaxID=1027966 RepID=UPI002A761CFD|nr:DEAD/DEAH box helicase [Pseudomonas sp. HR96]WPO98798.1 DEAD/DEAH box helicase [Pseudomonas sp. HR96]
MSQCPLTRADLPYHCQAVLFGLITAFPGRGKNSLLKIIRAMDVTDESGRLLNIDTLLETLEWLKAEGWVVGEQRQEGHYYCVAFERRNQVLLSLTYAADGSYWLQAITDHMPASQPWKLFPTLQELWLYLLTNNIRRFENSLRMLGSFAQDMPAWHPMHQLQGDAAGLEFMAFKGNEVSLMLVEHYLYLNNLRLGPVGPCYRLAVEQLRRTPNSALGLQLQLQAIWRGDQRVLDSFSDQMPTLPKVMHGLCRGQVDQALALLRGILVDQRKETRKRRIDFPPVLNGLYCLLLLAENDPKQRAALKQALTLGIQESFGAAYPVLYKLYEQLQGGKAQLSAELPDTLNGLDGLMLALGLYWLDAPKARLQRWCTRLEAYREQLQDEGYLWLAAEFDALIAEQFGGPRRLAEVHERDGLQPLVGLFMRQETWQHALSALSQLKPSKASTVTAEGDPRSRLSWFIAMDRYPHQLEPREQKRNAKGVWSKGRPLSLKRLAEDGAGLDYLCEQDRQTIAAIQVSKAYYSSIHYELPLELGLPRLVGHPALFWEDAPDVRIDLLEGQASLRLQAGKGAISLQLEPPGVVNAQQIFLDKETPTRLVVYPLNRELRQIAEIIGDGLTVPQSAKAQLIAAVNAIAPLLPIHSDLPELTGHLDRAAADTRLYAHLLPLAEGLRLQLLVRPLAEGSWLRPGQGAENLLGERDGKPLQVHRDLAGERQALQRVLQACPGLADADSDGHEWQLDQPQRALQVLSELQAIASEQLQCIWPEGERMRIGGRSSLRQLKLGLRQQDDWFMLQGEIPLDNGKVLQLRQLLALFKANPGRFVRLDDGDWLALDDSLRKRLDELGHLAERVTEQGLRLSQLTAPLLANLAQEVGAFEADQRWQAHLDKLQSLRDFQPQVPATLHAELRGYQREGFAWLSRLAHWGVGACLADDMGLGKTVQTLALLLERATRGPQLVVAPTSVTLNWQAECQRFAPHLNVRVYQQQRSLTDLGANDLVIASYGLLQQESAAFAAQPWTSVVLDEAQAIKNAQTKRSQAVMALKADFRLVATGTPLENHLGELWNLFNFINPGLLGSQESFATRFSIPIEKGDGAARRALKALIQPFILRRLKSQVLDELPTRTEITYKVPLSEDEAHHYEALRQAAVDNLAQLNATAGKSMQVLAEITRLRRFCCHPTLVLPSANLPGSKFQAFTEIVGELLENRHKALVFSQFVDHLSIARAWLDQQGIRYQYLDGSTPAKERQNRVEAFQAGVGDIFLISLKAGGSGLNLTAADYVIHLDPWWNPAVEDQASDRAHRMGQQKPVTIYRLVAEHTIEEQIVALHARKRDLADSLLEGGEISAKLDADALLELLKG